MESIKVMTDKYKKHIPAYIFSSVLFVFGMITLFLSSSVIFDLFGVRAMEGNYVLFVVWANFISSIIYLIAAYGVVKEKNWTTMLMGISVVILIAAFAGLMFYINAGGIYETKTISAMIFRISISLIFTTIAYLLVKKNEKNEN